MEYLNQFHKESTERKLREIQEWRKYTVNYEKEYKRHMEMHRKFRNEESQSSK